MENGAIISGYDPITSNQAVISSSLSGMDWFGNVVEVRVDEEKGELIFDEALTREGFFQALRRVSYPSTSRRDKAKSKT